jgi:hypothetical protein
VNRVESVYNVADICYLPRYSKSNGGGIYKVL